MEKNRREMGAREEMEKGKGLDNAEIVMRDNNGWELKGVGQARVLKT